MKKQHKIEHYRSMLLVNQWNYKDYFLENIEKAEQRLKELRNWINGDFLATPGLNSAWLLNEAKILKDLVDLEGDIQACQD